MGKDFLSVFFHSRDGIKMYLWIFRPMFYFCFSNPFPDGVLCTFLEAKVRRERRARVWEVPHFAASWLSLYWLHSSGSLHFTCVPVFGVLVCEVRGVSFLPVHASISARVIKGSSWDWDELSVQWVRGGFSVLYTTSPYARGPAKWTSAPEGCCHYPPPACPATLGTSQIWRLQASEAGDAAARFLWRQKWKMRDN